MKDKRLPINLLLGIVLGGSVTPAQAAIINTLVSADVRTYASDFTTVQRDVETGSTAVSAYADFGTPNSAYIESLFQIDNLTGTTLDMLFNGYVHGGETGGRGMETTGYPPQNFAMVHYHAAVDSTMTYDWRVQYPARYAGTDVLHFYLYETEGGSLPTFVEGTPFYQQLDAWWQIGYGGDGFQSNTLYTGTGSAQLTAGRDYAFAIWHNLNVDGGMAGTNFLFGMEGSVSIDFGVSAVPLPPSVWLLGTGLLGLSGIRRRISRFS